MSVISNSISVHAFFFILSIISLQFSYSLQTKTIVCLDIEKQSLLSFKKSLNDSFNRFSSWNGEVDCCKWNGVVCNYSTGHVHELQLQGFRLRGKLNPSLINLKHLTHLDLSFNNFLAVTIPSFIGSFAQLEYLNLSYAGFRGKIPYNVGNLSNLHALDLDSSYDLSGRLYVDSLEWLSGLSKLEHLSMNGVNLGRATNWAKEINSLSSLLEIYCSHCGLDFTSPLNMVNLTSLTHIDFSYNYQSIPVPFPRWFFKLENLLYLRLVRMMNFIGPLPSVINATKLQYIDLSDNDLNSSIPKWLYLCKDLEIVRLHSSFLKDEISNAIANLTSLETLDFRENILSGKIPREITSICTIKALLLSWNELHGDVHDSFGNMSACFLGSLEYLSLSSNRLSGHLTEKFGQFRSLVGLVLSNNSLSGGLPISLGNLSRLEYIRLDYNNISGNLPEGLGHFSEMEFFIIENNKLEGVVTHNHFANLSKLIAFMASGNQLTLNVGTNWVPPIQLRDLGLGSWRLGVGASELPSWLQTQRNITHLDISNAGISGSIPGWFFDVVFLNVSHNNLYGSIPPKILFGRSLYLSSNKLSGSLPGLGVQVGAFDVSHNSLSKGIYDLICFKETDNIYLWRTNMLYLLNLEGNLLSGELPDCWDKWPNLETLNLANNTLSGNLPNSIGLLPHLEYLSLHHNKFCGQIPSSIHNGRNLLKIDLSHNNLDGNLPLVMGTSLVKLKYLMVRSNRLRGEISPNICHLQSLQLLDLSGNMFFGIIPNCVSNFTAMAIKRSLSLESYATILDPSVSACDWQNGPFDSVLLITKGSELEYSTTLSLVTAIDLSRNNLSGEIPKELTSLVALRSLNLSQNHLSGSIPERIGNMKELESLDFSRNSLSGPIPNSLAQISSLSCLNLSFNKLTGKIPEGSQLQTLDASSFVGNHLCGPPLNNCSHGGGDEVHPQKEEEGEIKWLYVLVSLGYAVGFSAVCSALVLKKSWRDAYFGLLECVWDNMYVYWHIKWASLKNSAASIWQNPQSLKSDFLFGFRVFSFAK